MLSAHTLFFALLLLLRLAHATRQRPEPGAEIRLLGVALILADAALSDWTIPVRTWARLMGIAVAEVVTMKREFLSGVGFDLSAGGYGEFLRTVVGSLLAVGGRE
ncbi:hypothetical protein BDK51DRAFT_29184 [Blyttiomyces helicus]|uniref:Cyclin N-terminal domain-containing protein n=1 Tax=Blyttiomyces helicus TaxID=388810 RepID=A0A4P9WE61_9FUNG|nr:hypothetical protein BDK51DRAFT_29184 [Blyttiomyces helicus]|eukprot:RKO90874.1 hypothetical protein BDK51DRAFT_29184 [Blyttiomyces helicus]